MKAGRSALDLRIRINDLEHIVRQDESFVFGRDPGPGQITLDDRSVSGRHGLIELAGGVWQVSSTGSLYSFSVYDTETPSRLYVPLGAGPVRVPFAHAIIAIEIRDRRHAFEVAAAPAAAGWANGWRSVRDIVHPLREDDAIGYVRTPVGAGSKTTQMVWSSSQFLDRRGNVRRWYQVLVAMCEPRLRMPAERREERVPSNRQIANRLGISERTLEKHLDELRQHFGFDTYTDQMRIAAVLIATSQGIVTVADLAILDRPDRSGPGEPL